MLVHPRHCTILSLSIFCACAIGCNPLGVIRSEQALCRTGRYELIEGLQVPRVRGPSGCGAQALATVMHDADPSTDVQVECDALPWHDLGASAIDVLITARARGFEARVSRGTWDDLAEFVHNRQPVMVMFDRNLRTLTPAPKMKPPPAMHWGVVSGMSNDGKKLLCAARDAKHYVIDRKMFLECWSASDKCTIAISKSPADEHP